jgi:hypothetical protein
MVSSGVDDDMRKAASEFRKATGSIKRATDVKGAVRRAERTIREHTAAPPKPRTTPASAEAGEAGGPPVPPVESTGSSETEDTEPEGLSHP